MDFLIFSLYTGVAFSIGVLGVILGVKNVNGAPFITVVAGLLFLFQVIMLDNLDVGYETNRIANITISGGAGTVGQGDLLFSELYTTNTGWTQVGTLVTVDSGTADKTDFASATNNVDRRVHKALGISLTSADLFRWDFEFERQASTSLPSHLMAVLSAGTGAPKTASQDMITVLYGTGAYAGTGDCFAIASKDGAGTFLFNGATEICSGTNQVYYVRVDKISTTEYELNVFTDSVRTIHLAGSPTIVNIPSSVTGFTTIQHSVDSVGSASRTLDGTVDNTSIYELIVSGDDVLEEYEYFAPEAISIPFNEFDVWVFTIMLGLLFVFMGIMLQFSGGSKR